MKIITKCSICGAVMNVVFKNDGNNKEMLSHGMCPNALKGYKEIQVLVFNEELGIWTLDVAYEVRNQKIYYHTQFINTLICLNRKTKTVEIQNWNRCFYEVGEFYKYDKETEGISKAKQIAGPKHIILID